MSRVVFESVATVLEKQNTVKASEIGSNSICVVKSRNLKLAGRRDKNFAEV